MKCMSQQCGTNLSNTEWPKTVSSICRPIGLTRFFGHLKKENGSNLPKHAFWLFVVFENFKPVLCRFCLSAILDYSKSTVTQGYRYSKPQRYRWMFELSSIITKILDISLNLLSCLAPPFNVFFITHFVSAKINLSDATGLPIMIFVIRKNLRVIQNAPS
jgi:hypothetical protein